MRPHGGVWLTSGYFITLAAAQNLLNAIYPVWTVADHWRNFEAKGLLSLYALTPNPVWESELSRASHIAPERRRRRKDRKTLIDRLARVWNTAIVRPLFVETLAKVQGVALKPGNKTASKVPPLMLLISDCEVVLSDFGGLLTAL
jgi:glycosyl transferase family 25